jgi:hypothetical protein
MHTLGSGTAEEFYSHEFSNLTLNDKRLNARAKKIWVALQSNLTSCIRRLFLVPQEARQAYDFF